MNNLLHVTSNHFFAFHDDVFPAFAKNAASQPPFPQPSSLYTTIIPDKFFSSLKKLQHFSTIEMELDGADSFKFEVNFHKESNILAETRIIESKFFDDSTLFSFGSFQNGSLWIDSDFFDERHVLELDFKKLTKIAVHFHTHSIKKLSFVEIQEEKLNVI